MHCAALRCAALEGLDIALALEVAVSDDLEAGRLVRRSLGMTPLPGRCTCCANATSVIPGMQVFRNRAKAALTDWRASSAVRIFGAQA